MKSEPNRRKGQPLIPEGDFACVWMTAGMLGYRLCDREFDCARCPLDRALRNLPEPDRTAAEKTVPVAGGTEVPDDLFYHPGHTWVRVRPGGELEVGVDDPGRRLLDPVLGLRLPRRGTAVAAGRAAFTVSGTSGDVPVGAPFEGIVTRINPDLEADPARLTRDPYGDGWVYRAIPENPARALAGLREGREAEEWAESEARLVRDLLDVATASHEPAGVGPTLLDGGILADELLRGVAPEAARRILTRVFSTRER